MDVKEQYFYPLIEERLKTLGKLILAYKQRRGDFVPDFILETEDGKRIAVEVGCEIHPRHLVPRTLSRKAFQLLVYLHRFDQVLYIAPYEELRTVCNMLEQVGVKVGEKLQTADLGYIVGAETFEIKLQKIALELKKIKRCFRDHGYKL
jgi:hypothetical protein